MKPLRKVVVSRSVWLRGSGDSLLRGGDGGQCCLGFVCREAKLAESEITDVGAPDWLAGSPARRLRREFPLLFVEGTSRSFATGLDVASALCVEAMEVNDNPLIDDDAEREAQLVDIGIRLGIQFEFTD